MTKCECTQQEKIGKFMEFMDSVKGLRPTLMMISLAILIQVGTFLYLWGDLTTTVKNNSEDINRVLSKLDGVKIIGLACADTTNSTDNITLK